MRVLICDDHVVFAESLAHLLHAMGVDVVGVTFHPNQAVAVLRREPVDICLLDVMFGAENALGRLPDVRAAAPLARVVLLCALVDAQLITASRAAGIPGVVDKRQAISGIINVLDRVHAGELVLPEEAIPTPATRPMKPSAANHAKRLAAFLTPRERQVLGALVCGCDTTRLAQQFGITETTARCHIQAVLMKLGAHSRLEAATTAVRYGMVNPLTGTWLLPID